MDTKVILKACNIMQITLSFFTLVLFVAVRAPVEWKATYKETKSVVSSMWAVFRNTATLYYVLYLVLAVLGMHPAGHKVCNAILLLDILMKSPTCRDVCNAVIHPIKQLTATVLLMLFTMFIFTFIFFDLYHDHFKYGECNTLLRCSLVMLNFGVRNGGGLADILYEGENGPSNEMSWRFYIDFLYYVMVLIVLLNIVFGIIIDTFSELREEKKLQKEKTEDRCFICDIDKNKFEQLGAGSFDKHIMMGGDHNMWAYLQFIIFIEEQDQDDDDGLEAYIRECIATNNLDWFPNRNALAFAEYGDDEDTVESKAGKLVKHMKDNFMIALARIKNDAEEKQRAAISALSDASTRMSMPAQGAGGWNLISTQLRRKRQTTHSKKRTTVIKSTS